MYVCVRVIAKCVATSSSLMATPTQLQFSVPGKQQAAESETQYANEENEIDRNSDGDCAKIRTSAYMQECV